MDMKLILVLLMGFIALGYATPRVRREIIEPVPIEDAVEVFAIDPEAEDFEGSEQRYGGGYRGGYGGYRGGYGGGYGGYRGGYGGYRGGYGGGRRHHHWG